MKQNAVGNFRPQWAVKAIAFLWAATVDAEGFSSSDRASGLAFA